MQFSGGYAVFSDRPENTVEIKGAEMGINMKKKSWRKLWKNRNFVIGFCMVAVVLILMAVGFFYLPYDVDAIEVSNKLQPAGGTHLLGTDHLGRDILSRMMYGARISFLIGALVVLFGLVTGTLIGALAGYFGGKTDEIISKLIDTQMAFPGVLLALMMVAVFGNELKNIVLALGIMSIPRFARISRSGFMKYRDAEFVRASRVRGAGDFYIMLWHILPNIAPDMIVTCSLGFASAVMSEAGLSYLGLGIQPPAPSFGKMLSEAQNYILQASWYVMIPTIAITLLVMGFNLIGDGISREIQR